MRTTRAKCSAVPWWTWRLEGYVEPVADRIRAVGDERVAAPQLAPLHARQRESDALAGLRPLDRAVVHLDTAHAHVEAGRLGAELVALADRPRPEGAGDDGADPLEREHAVDVQPRGPVGRPLLDAVGGGRERRAQVIEALARARARLHGRRLRDELARLL